MKVNMRDSGIARLIKRVARITWPRVGACLPGVLGRGLVVEDTVVSLTTYGPRLEAVDAAIFSILQGSVRPSKLILVVNEELPLSVAHRLQRFEKYGLEVLRSEDIGPHKKYHPVVERGLPAHVSLVTADDDIFYGRHWLRDLRNMHLAHPEDVICGWAKRIVIKNDAIAGYHDWVDVVGMEAATHHFAIGCAGTLYPPSMVAALKAAGKDFLRCCPRADDVWLHATAVRTGHRIRQVTRQFIHPIHLPGTQESALKVTNHLPDGNDKAIHATYTQEDVGRIVQSVALA
ncbi:hypothetical protein [Xylophilus sp. GOD-11R]|uniref:hypothetical protein n=1 Tax=Xylophilus sp. GOD-11R TaxID=3089814 RepID=UPI00298BCB4C|nr:hypothetical protein [Xylophilus sp. GOD-11R]WPB58899.1 hypothetical protein R9X41_09805 [Xylophilus sp. GOD-11R]